jgi:hypothetical protein
MAGRNASDDDVPIWVLDTVTKPAPEHEDSVIVAGSHGGVYPGYLIAKAAARGVILNDAGIGKDKAGIASLDYLDAFGIAAATIAHMTGRIGDGEDMIQRGIVSYTNKAAGALGCAVGEAALEAARKMRLGPVATMAPDPFEEARYKLRAEPGEPEVWGLDSASLLIPEDAGRIVITGSHGGVLAANRASGTAIYQPVKAAVFHDAGIGRDQAGLSRLPLLDDKGIAGAVIDGKTARIGDARSLWESGVVSHINETARLWGLRAGLTCQDFAVGAAKKKV